MFGLTLWDRAGPAGDDPRDRPTPPASAARHKLWAVVSCGSAGDHPVGVICQNLNFFHSTTRWAKQPEGMVNEDRDT